MDQQAVKDQAAGAQSDAVLPDMDLITFEVLRNALSTVTEEMAVTLRRTAYSTNIKTRGDFSTCIIDGDMRVIAQSGMPGHLVSIATAVPQSIKEIGLETMGPGDMFVVNDPYRGSNHLNDLTVFAPIYADGALIAIVANMAHHVDVGGATPASLGVSTEIYQEGLIISPTRIVKGGEIVTDVIRLILSNFRPKREVYGDLRAQMSSNTVAMQRIAELIAQYTAPTLRKFFDEVIAYTDRWVESEIRRLPEGTFRAESYRDDDGVTDTPVKLVAAITFKDGRAILDITGSSPQVAGPLNATRTMAQVTIMHLIRCIGDPRIPNNSGFLQRTSVVGPPGTVLTAQAPAAVVGAFETTFQLFSTLLKAMHPVMPDRIPACSKSLVMCLGFAGTDPRSGEYYCYMETVAGGDGARPSHDGYDAVQSELQDTENAPIEEVELGYPVVIRRYELIRDSGGRGRFRGGLGIRRDFEFPYGEASFSLLADGRKFAPWGLMGGEPGRTARFQYIEGSEVRELPSKITFRVPKGGMVRVETPGGGGFGDPALRDPGAIAADVVDGKVSAAAADAIE